MQWAGLAFASLLGGFLKGATGFGGALVLAPFFVALAGPRESTVLIVLIHAFTSLQGFGGWKASVRWPGVVALTAFAVIAAAFFTGMLDHVDTHTAKRIAGGVVMALALLQISGWRWRHSGGALPAMLTGLLSGVCTAAAGTGGPPAVIYFSGGASSKEGVRANLLAYFVLLYALTACTLWWQGKVTADLLLKSAALSPLFFFGSMGGEQLFLRMENHHFDRMVAGLLVLSGAAMLLV